MESSTSKSRVANYKPHEGRVLCLAWLNVSCDPISGIYQTGDDFYVKVKAAFDDELRRQDAFVADRTASSLSSRFQTISHAVSKFVACHNKVVAACPSGRAPVDLEHDAVAVYESAPMNGSFKFLQCWYVLRDSPKWGAWRESAKKRKTPRKRQHVEIDSEVPEAHSNIQSDSRQSDESISPDDQQNSLAEPQPRPPGSSRAKMDRANLALYARQVKAAERAVANAGMRIKVAQEQLDLSLFSIAGNPEDPLTSEFLAIKRQAVLKRLRAEMEGVQPQSSQHKQPQLSQRVASPPHHSIVDAVDQNFGADAEISQVV